MFNTTNNQNNTAILIFAGFISLVPLLTGQAVYAASAVEQGFALPGISYHGQGKPLLGRNPASAHATVHDFLASQGWDAASLDSLTDKSSMPTTQGQTMLVLEQQVDGFPVYGAQAKALFDAEGNLLELSGTLIETHGALAPARIEPVQALNAALAKVYPNHASSLKEINRSDAEVVYGGDRLFSPNPKVTLVGVPEQAGVVVQGFLVELWSQKDNQLNHVLVSSDGQVLEVQNRTADDSYNVFTEYPSLISSPFQTTIFGPNSTVPSPNGWLNSSTQYKTYIQGNNVKAYLDRDKNDSPDTPATGTDVLDGMFDSIANLIASPTTADNQAVAVQNLFYFNNSIHDELYGYGFTESAFNFQTDNFGRGGVANDPVNAEAQDGGGTNNANFATPADGASPRMQMYLWTLSNPYRDGDVDGDIVWHEYGHGLTWRTIGNMSGIMGGALGEGASDVLAIIKYDDPIVGEYSYNNSNGIRTAPYDDRYAATGRTYESVCAGGCEVHRDGEIFAAIMWDMWDRYKVGSTSKAAARDSLMNDFVGGMKKTDYQCNRPTFPTVRNGILNAISTGSVTTTINPPTVNDPNLPRWCDTWKAFAKYGVGTDQNTTCTTTITSISWTWNNGFGIPAACGASTFIPPTAPGNSLSATSVSTSQIDLAWPTYNPGNETGFKIERCKGANCTNFSLIATLGADATSYSNKKLQRNTSYSYRINAYNSYGSSAYSNVAIAKTKQ